MAGNTASHLQILSRSPVPAQEKDSARMATSLGALRNLTLTVVCSKCPHKNSPGN